MISPYFLLMLFISKPCISMMLISMCGCNDATLTISLIRDIAIVQYSWGFHSNDDDYSTIVFPSIFFMDVVS